MRKHEEAIPYFQRAAKYFFMANNLELAGLCYIEEGKAFLKLNKLAQALDAFKTALTTFEDINITSIRKGEFSNWKKGYKFTVISGCCIENSMKQLS